MITMYSVAAAGLVPLEITAGALPERAVVAWIDLLSPTRDEELAVEKLLGLQVPTREETIEIEESARLYREGEVIVLTATMVDGAADDRPQRATLTFVLTPAHLVTVRYADPVPFRLFAAKCQRHPEQHGSSSAILVSLLETIVERAADVLELVAADLTAVSTRLFFEDAPKKKHKGTSNDVALQALIRRLGRKNMTISILRESFLSLGRLVSYFRVAGAARLDNELQNWLKQLDRDLRSLASYEQQLSSEIVYLHDATLGLINLDQNRIIKVFSIAAVLFLPPTVVGTIYGMNFDFMPELGWLYGYPMALGLMVVSALIPYFWFRFKRWF